MSTQNWLKDVQEFKANGDGVAPALAAIGNALDQELQQPALAAGDIGAAEVTVAGSGVEYVVYVSTGQPAADIARVSEAYGVPADLVKLMLAAEMLESHCQGVARCTKLR